MARTKNTDSTVTKGAVENTAPNSNNVGVRVNTELKDTDEIKVVSLIPHVSYKDLQTGDYYEWDEVGHIEYMTYAVIKNMWRNNKTYFRDLWLKPIDDRIISKFGLTKSYDKYENLMNNKAYTRQNISKICEEISSIAIGLKYSVFNKIKSMVFDGEITDIQVIRTLEKNFNLDLTSAL